MSFQRSREWLPMWLSVRTLAAFVFLLVADGLAEEPGDSDALPSGALVQLSHGTDEGAGIYQLRFSPDGQALAARNAAQQIQLWDWRDASLRTVMRGHSSRIQDFCFARNGKYVITVTEAPSEQSRIWDSANGKAIDEIPLVGTKVAEFSDHSIGIFSGQKARFVFVPRDAAKEVKRIYSRRNGAVPLAFSVDRNRILYGSVDGPTLRPNPFPGRPNPIPHRMTQMKFDIVDWRHPQDVTTLVAPGGMLQAAALFRSPSGEQIAVAFRRTNRLMWTPNGGVSLRRERLNAHSDSISDLCVSPDGRFLATTSWDRTIKLWETCTSEEILQLQGHEDKVLCAEFSPDGRFLATGGAAGDNSVIVWDLFSLLLGKTNMANHDRLKAHWAALQHGTAEFAYHSVAWLAQHPDLAVEFMERQFVSEQVELSDSEVARWIRLLDSDSFQQRNEAFHYLFKQRAVLRDRLEVALGQAVSTEVELQLRRLLSAPLQPTKMPLQERKLLARAIFLLEQFDDPRARRILKYLADQKSGDPIYDHAAEVWARVSEKRPGV